MFLPSRGSSRGSTVSPKFSIRTVSPEVKALSIVFKNLHIKSKTEKLSEKDTGVEVIHASRKWQNLVSVAGWCICRKYKVTEKSIYTSMLYHISVFCEWVFNFSQYSRRGEYGILSTDACTPLLLSYFEQAKHQSSNKLLTYTLSEALFQLPDVLMQSIM